MRVWKLHWGPRLYLDLIFEPRDLWVGVFVKRWFFRRDGTGAFADVECYLCAFPTLALRVRLLLPKGAWEREFAALEGDRLMKAFGGVLQMYRKESVDDQAL